ncbi:retrotransposon protein, putative, ty1-copia subclass [Tanacetum coccineum]
MGIVSQLTQPYTPQHNGVSERRNQTLLDMVRSMMNLTTLPKSFWGYTLESDARILNIVLTKKVDRTPYEIWHGKRYPKEMMGYYFYYPLENKIFVARNVEFFENGITVQKASGSHGLLEVSGSDVRLELIQEDDTQPYENTSDRHIEVKSNEVEPHSVEVLIRRPGRISQAPDIYGSYVDDEEHELGDHNEPPNYKATLSYPESDKWLNARNTEMQSMKDNQVWCARLVAKGHTQTYVVDYGETFSPVADIRAIRILLAIAAFYDYEIWHMDVKEWSPKRGSSRSWNKRFDEEIKKLGFTQNPDELCVYLKASGITVAFLVLYVDDILIMRNNITMLQDVKSWLCAKTHSKVKRMQRVPYILAIGSIMYAVRCTRPDVTFVQNLCSQFTQNPGEAHWTAVKTILKYLRNTKDMFLVYGENPETKLKLTCYTDAGFQTDKDDTKSQLGYVFVLNG